MFSVVNLFSVVRASYKVAFLKNIPIFLRITFLDLLLIRKMFQIVVTRIVKKKTRRRPMSHAIMSSMQYYPEDMIAYAIMSAGWFYICNRVRPDAAA